jgi:hypothetical protein
MTTIEELELTYLTGHLPSDVKELLAQYPCSIEGSVLIIRCQGREEASNLRHQTFISIAGLINANQEQFLIREIAYKWGNRKGQQIKLPLVDRLWLQKKSNPKAS